MVCFIFWVIRSFQKIHVLNLGHFPSAFIHHAVPFIRCFISSLNSVFTDFSVSLIVCNVLRHIWRTARSGTGLYSQTFCGPSTDYWQWFFSLEILICFWCRGLLCLQASASMVQLMCKAVMNRTCVACQPWCVCPKNICREVTNPNLLIWGGISYPAMKPWSWQRTMLSTLSFCVPNRFYFGWFCNAFQLNESWHQIWMWPFWVKIPTTVATAFAFALLDFAWAFAFWYNLPRATSPAATYRLAMQLRFVISNLGFWYHGTESFTPFVPAISRPFSDPFLSPHLLCYNWPSTTYYPITFELDMPRFQPPRHHCLSRFPVVLPFRVCIGENGEAVSGILGPGCFLFFRCISTLFLI